MTSALVISRETDGVYVLSGALLGSTPDPYTEAVATLTGEQNEYAGYLGIIDGSDLDGDLDDEVVVFNCGDANRGRAYLLTKPVSGSGSLSATSGVQTIEGASDGDGFGSQGGRGGGFRFVVPTHRATNLPGELFQRTSSVVSRLGCDPAEAGSVSRVFVQRPAAQARDPARMQ